jgi:hypothetical protein
MQNGMIIVLDAGGGSVLPPLRRAIDAVIVGFPAGSKRA